MYLYNFNSCCCGRWSRTNSCQHDDRAGSTVLILVVVDDGLVRKGQVVGRI